MRRKMLAVAGVLAIASGMAWRETGNAFVPSGEVHGYVSVVYGGTPIRLPDASVYLQNITTGAVGPIAKTNAHGWFDTERHINGRYAICASATGIPLQCGAQLITLKDEAVVLAEDFRLPAPARSAHGRVRLQDGTPCYGEDLNGRPVEVTRVSLLDVNSGLTLRGPVTANGDGDYIIGDAPQGQAIVSAECEGSRNVRLFNFQQDVGPGGSAIALTLQNRRPRMLPATVIDAAGARARYPLPGETLTVTANVDDPDADTLHYEWIAASGEIINNCDMPSISWRLPQVSSMNVLSLRVTDARGGVATGTVRIASGASPIFSGRVVNAATSQPIAGASVDVNGGPASTTTETGAFLIRAARASRYVLNVSRSGYAMFSESYPDSQPGLTVPLRTALRITCGPLQDCGGTQPGSRGMTLAIPAGAFMDASGQSATVPVNVDFLAYDLSQPNSIPGATELAGRNNGQDVALRSFGAFSVSASDAAGKRYNLKPGFPARVALTAQLPQATTRRRVVHHGIGGDAAENAAPNVIDIWRYDEPTGIWIRRGEARLNASGAYDMTIPTFSAWNADVQFTSASCARIVVDEAHTSYPFRIRFNINGTIIDVQVTDLDNILRLLPPNTVITAEVQPVFGPPNTVPTIYTINTGAAASSLYPTNYQDCNAFDVATGLKPVVISLPGLPSSHAAAWLSRKTNVSNPSAEAALYYQHIGAIPAKDTLTKWKNINGFPAGEVVAYYYNALDLGLGRQMHCRQNGAGAACYVTNFGIGPGGSADIAVDNAATNTAPIATVAMEYTPPANLDDSVKFYVYDNFGNISQNAVLDSEGAKVSPFICLSCHGGNYNASTHSISGASFREFDVFSFLYHPTLPAFQRPAQEESFRQLNAIVKSTSPAASNSNNPIVSLIDGMYPGGVGNAGSVAVDTYVPPTWVTASKSALYQQIPRNFCRACHIAQSSSIDWVQESNFTSLFKVLIGSDVCSQKVMPHAEVPFKKFWLSGAPDYLSSSGTGIGLGGCPP